MTGRRYVEVKWEDAHGGAEHGWEDVPDDIKPAPMLTVGILVKETAKAYCVALSFDVDAEKVGSYILIPKGGVTSIKELRPARVRRG